jgi:hypothetical protein
MPSCLQRDRGWPEMPQGPVLSNLTLVLGLTVCENPSLGRSCVHVVFDMQGGEGGPRPFDGCSGEAPDTFSSFSRRAECYGMGKAMRTARCKRLDRNLEPGAG